MIYFWNQNSVPSTHVPNLLRALQYLGWSNSVVSLRFGNVSLLTLFFFNVILATLDLSHFHMNFRITFSISAKKGSWNFDRYYTESGDQLREDCRDSSKSSDQGTHDVFFYLGLSFVSTMFCSFQCLSLSVYTSSVKFIPKYFIFFDSTVNGIVFVISFSCPLVGQAAVSLRHFCKPRAATLVPRGARSTSSLGSCFPRLRARCQLPIPTADPYSNGAWTSPKVSHLLIRLL